MLMVKDNTSNVSSKGDENENLCRWKDTEGCRYHISSTHDEMSHIYKSTQVHHKSRTASAGTTHTGRF